MKEVWKDIKGYEGKYRISNKGRVESLYKNTWRGYKFYSNNSIIMKLSKDSGRYLVVTLSDGKKRKNFKIHRLVAQAFIPNIENKPQVNHINGIKNDNRVENLEWVTQKENQYHAKINNLKASGENSGKSKLTNKIVLQIRKEYKKNKNGYRKLARKYNVSQRNICCIVKKITWNNF